MPKKYIKLSSYEQNIEDKIDYNKLKKTSEDKQKQIKVIASETLREIKSERANIRLSESDMNAVRSLAEKSGLPYQTLIAHILHLYVTEQLISVSEVKKMIVAGIFSRKAR